MKLCPSCGEKDKPFVGAFCVDCFAKKPLAEITAKGLELQICPKCGRVKEGSAWKEFSEEIVEELVERKAKSQYPFKLAISFNQAKGYLASKADFVFTVEGTPVKQTRYFEIPLVKDLCIDCSRQSGGYKEAIVQIRGYEERRAQRIVRILEEKLEGKTFWKTEFKKNGGVDLITGGKNVTLDAVRSLRLPFSMTHKLAGVRQGKKIFLVTVLIKFGKIDRTKH